MPRTFKSQIGETIILFFQSHVSGEHFNTAKRGVTAIIEMITVYLKSAGLEAEIDHAVAKINAWYAVTSKRKTYGDLWIGFSNTSWITLSFDPYIQDIFRIPKSKVQTRRTNILIDPKGKPRFVRVWDYNNKARPKRPFRYTIVLTGHYRKWQKRRGDEVTGNYYIQCAEDPDEFFQMYEKMDGIVDYIYKSYRARNIGSSNPILGKRIEWDDLPVAVKRRVLPEYIKLWDITDVPRPAYDKKRRLFYGTKES